MEERRIETFNNEQLELLSMILYLKEISYKIEILSMANKVSYLVTYMADEEMNDYVTNKFYKLGSSVSGSKQDTKEVAIVRRYKEDGEVDLSIEDLFGEIKETIRMKYGLSEISYGTWIKPLSVYRVEDNILYIKVPDINAHEKEYLEKKYKSVFHDVIEKMLDKNYSIQFIYNTDIVSK